ncbi:MAG: DUF58 domain-containing protein [Rhizomicrobium sp.]
MIYPTSRAVFLASLGIPAALLLAVAAPRLWLVGAVWVMFVACVMLLDALAAGLRSAVQIVPDLPNGLAVGETSHAGFSIRFGRFSTPRNAEVALDVNPRIVSAPYRQSVAIENRTADAGFALTVKRRGEGRFERLWVRWQGPLGLAWSQKREELAKSLPIVPNLRSVKEEAIRLFRRDIPLGAHIQLNMAEGSEFHALRSFEAGMDRRMIDWKQSAKHGILLAKEFQAERNQHIVMALDTGRLMSEPVAGAPRLDRALQAILLLAYVGLKLGDRVGLFAFDEKPRLRTGTVAGPAAFSHLQRLASQLDYSTAETNFTLGLTQLSGELEHRSIVIVFTDFVDTTSAELLLENIGRLLQRHLVLFVLFHDVELEDMVRARPEQPGDVSRAVIADALLRERDIVVERLRRLGVQVVDVPPEQLGMGVLAAYLAAKRQDRV